MTDANQDVGKSLQITMEVERVINLVRGFGWDKIGEDIDNGIVVLKLQKRIVPPV